MNTQAEITALVRELLGDSYTHLHVNRVLIEEDLEQRATSVNCEVTDEVSSEAFVIAGKGVGLIDAFFRGVEDRFATEYPSLKTISFSSFSVQARLDTKQGFAGTDSEGEVTLQDANSAGQAVPLHPHLAQRDRRGRSSPPCSAWSTSSTASARSSRCTTRSRTPRSGTALIWYSATPTTSPRWCRTPPTPR